MTSKAYKKLYKTLNILSIIFSVLAIVMLLYFKDDILKYNNSATCPENCEQQIDKLEAQHYNDSISLEIIEKDYYEVWEENQIFSSMLSEIESEPGGHDILQKLWKKHNNDYK